MSQVIVTTCFVCAAKVEEEVSEGLHHHAGGCPEGFVAMRVDASRSKKAPAGTPDDPKVVDAAKRMLEERMGIEMPSEFPEGIDDFPLLISAFCCEGCLGKPELGPKLDALVKRKQAEFAAEVMAGGGFFGQHAAGGCFPGVVPALRRRRRGALAIG